MKKVKIIKKINVILAIIFIISIMFSNYSLAVGDAFSDADEFLGKRRLDIEYNR
ncbi:MAG: hypothetical protein J6A29_00980 [Clostridia bacterium]|nr:hypothetical protein [Clostridia bacterium]